MSGSDVDLFAKSAFQKSRNIGRLDFQPTFDDELPYDPVIAGKCNNVSSCISDAVISGLVAVGVNTKQGIQETQTKAAETSEHLFYLFYFLCINWLNIQKYK